MKNSITFGTAVLALTAVATSCTTVAGQSKRSDKVYLVGVAGAG
ncbi:MAG: hypothetical protein ACKVWV_02795 [Planctomycetota bacterium]